MVYAGFWRRFCAYVIDYVIVVIMLYVLVVPMGVVFGLSAGMAKDREQHSQHSALSVVEKIIPLAENSAVERMDTPAIADQPAMPAMPPVTAAPEAPISEEFFGGIDILINNAGISMRVLLKDAGTDVFKKVMDINYFGVVYCTKYALDSIIERKGTIVGVTSIAGYRGLPGRSGYSASKYALQGWLDAIRTELMDDGVHVMWVCPGFTTSNIRNAALNKDADSHGETPMDETKMMTAGECAGHILRSIRNKKRTLVLTFTGKRTVFMNKFFPKLTDRMVHKFFIKDGKLVK